MPELRADAQTAIAHVNVGSGHQVGMPEFLFRAAAWDGIMPWNDYETRVLTLAQEAFVGYSRYVRVVHQASQNGAS